MIITRKSLAQITEMCMTEKLPVEKAYKNYTLFGFPIVEPRPGLRVSMENLRPDFENPDSYAVTGLTITWSPREN